jgi:hypothetical protein
MAPAGGPCFDVCQRNAAVCGQGLRDCESACLGLVPACDAAASAYYECALTAPLACSGDGAGGADGAAGAGGANDAETPCFDQALEFLHCVGY